MPGSEVFDASAGAELSAPVRTAIDQWADPPGAPDEADTVLALAVAALPAAALGQSPPSQPNDVQLGAPVAPGWCLERRCCRTARSAGPATTAATTR